MEASVLKAQVSIASLFYLMDERTEAFENCGNDKAIICYLYAGAVNLMMSWTGLMNSSYPEGYIYSQKSHPAIKWLTAPAPSRGQVSTASWYPSRREEEGGGPQSTIFLRPWHISASCRVILLAWVRKHVSHLYNKWDNFISFSLCSLHYGKSK